MEAVGLADQQLSEDRLIEAQDALPRVSADTDIMLLMLGMWLYDTSGH